MSPLDVVALLLGLAAVGYLLVALLKPDVFS
ncbi:potassium-transporting ATPase subunit F [Microcella daejeonensis]|uniref:Potassium-transporting ATPase subunit F n=1 Tax=Microcella daejeonensis TaxID=2994971 RepID=A0A9E8MMH4_9MICO|nr:potassium-transporting ATPase subunit F [Microcella daejeonensis]WAB82380.1 potassium-transporting ATPase subunit F [Microcella daejeonensis]WAB84558.1 potassium-transporting ATPase subunit F [Microcella daejeonensis]